MIGYNICVIFPEESPTTVASNTTIVKMLCSLVSLNNKTVNRFSNLHETLKTGDLIKMKNNICSIKKEEIDNLPHTWQLAVLGISYLFLVVFFFAPSCSLEGGSPWSPIQNIQRSYSRNNKTIGHTDYLFFFLKTNWFWNSGFFFMTNWFIMS